MHDRALLLCRLAVAAAYKGAWEHYGKSKASWLAGARLAQRFALADATQLACLDSHVQHLAQLMRQQSDSGQQLLQLDLTLAPQGDVEADDLLELQRPLQDGVHCLTMQLDDNLQIAPLLAGYTFSQLQRAKLRSAVSSEYSLAHSTCFGLAAPELLSLRLAHAALRQAAELSPSLVFLELENVHISAQAASQLFAGECCHAARAMGMPANCCGASPPCPLQPVCRLARSKRFPASSCQPLTEVCGLLSLHYALQPSTCRSCA